MTLSDEELIKMCYDKFGKDYQFRMLIEESAELTHAICKYIRNPESSRAYNVAQEHAHLELMLLELREVMSIECKSYQEYLEHWRKETRDVIKKRLEIK